MANSGVSVMATTNGLNGLPLRWPKTEICSNERPRRRLGVLLIVIVFAALAQGCATPPERNPLPENLYERSEIPGIPGARHWGDEPPPYADKLMAMPREELRARFPSLFGRPITLLAISGGGADGAFGAGVLNGWTASGTRPEFSFVTGISTGSLLAPFAYLGPQYDHIIRRVYTAYTTGDLVKKRGLVGIVEIDAIADTAPLRAVIAEYVDEALMQAIAEEYGKGRFLLLGTTNLDAARPVVWNIGEIAASGAPGALDLIRDVMLASASIPVAFPPQIFQVEVDGGLYDEMHVDGGVTRQSFLFSFGMDDKIIAKRLEAEGRTTAYIIRNSKLEPGWQSVNHSIVEISGRSISSLIRTQGIGDLYSEYLGARANGFDFNLAFIPGSFNVESNEIFDPEYMGALYKLGYDLAKKGYPWEKRPPGVLPR